jgi:Flp pilus assembly protein protease CpaA
MTIVAAIALSVLYGIAVYTDLKSRKIYNWLTLPAMTAGLFCLLFQSVWGALLTFALLLFLGVLNALWRFWAFGDVKLFVAAGLWSAILLDYHGLVYSITFYIMNIFFYLLTGLFYLLKMNKFNIRKSVQSLYIKSNQRIAMTAAAVTIFLSNVSMIIIFLF